MTIRKILLPLTGTSTDASAIATALSAAHYWKAHVLALHVRADARDVGGDVGGQRDGAAAVHG